MAKNHVVNIFIDRCDGNYMSGSTSLKFKMLWFSNEACAILCVMGIKTFWWLFSYGFKNSITSHEN